MLLNYAFGLETNDSSEGCDSKYSEAFSAEARLLLGDNSGDVMCIGNMCGCRAPPKRFGLCATEKVLRTIINNVKENRGMDYDISFHKKHASAMFGGLCRYAAYRYKLKISNKYTPHTGLPVPDTLSREFEEFDVRVNASNLIGLISYPLTEADKDVGVGIDSKMMESIWSVYVSSGEVRVYDTISTSYGIKSIDNCVPYEKIDRAVSGMRRIDRSFRRLVEKKQE